MPTCAVVGLEGVLIEASIGPGLPASNIVGSPDALVQEAKVWPDETASGIGLSLSEAVLDWMRLAAVSGRLSSARAVERPGLAEGPRPDDRLGYDASRP